MGQRLFPDPTVDEANGGWTILYPFLQHVQSLIVDDDIVGTPSLETIEAVLVAAEKALSKAAETGAQATNSAMDAMREIREVIDSGQDAFSKCADIRSILARHQ